MLSEKRLAKRRGWLGHGNPPGDLSTAKRCGARARTRGGAPCRGPAMRNDRCRMHGGLSTGPRTVEGLERSRRARLQPPRLSAADLREIDGIVRRLTRPRR